jgi:antitoxin ParD1/3/4
MSKISVSLPENMRQYVEAQVANGTYGNVSEYVRDLIRHDQKRRAKKILEALIIESLESGESIEVNNALKEQMHQELRARIQKKRESK